MFKVLLMVIGAFICFMGAMLLIAPELYLSLYAVNYSEPMDFAAQRFAPIVIGFGVMLFVARNVVPNEVIIALTGVTSLVWLGVAATGVFHFLTGVAGPLIMVAAGLEAGLAVLFGLGFWDIRRR